MHGLITVVLLIAVAILWTQVQKMKKAARPTEPPTPAADVERRVRKLESAERRRTQREAETNR